MTVQPRLASTVMLLRDGVGGKGDGGLEVFMVRRVVQSEFMPDLYVFPGGSASGDDRAAEQTEGICVRVAAALNDPEGLTDSGSGIRAAAIREVFEEANILLAYYGNSTDRLLKIDQETEARFAAYREAFNERRGSLVEMARAENLELAADRLVYCAHWITPEGMPKRFDTYFFLAAVPAGQEALYDRLETSEGVWVRPTEALERFKAGAFPVAFPTFHQLRDLSVYNSVQQALEAVRDVPLNMPTLVFKDGRPHHVYLPEEPELTWTLS